MGKRVIEDVIVAIFFFPFLSTGIQFQNFDGVCQFFIPLAAGWAICYRPKELHIQQWYGFVAEREQCLADACKLHCALL